MSTTNQIDPMAVISPMASGVIATAMVSAMIHTFGSMVPYVTTTSAFSKSTTPSKSANPSEELRTLDIRIHRLIYVMENQKEAVRGTRIHKEKLMREYGFGVMPSVVEMQKYPKLRNTDHLLTKAEKDLDRMELSMMFLQRRRKELQTQYGLRAEEEERIRHYTATKSERRYK